MNAATQSNFSHLKAHDEQLVRLGLLAERYFPDNPNTCLLKLRQLAESLAQLTASRVGLFTNATRSKLTCYGACKITASCRARSVPFSTRSARLAMTPITS